MFEPTLIDWLLQASAPSIRYLTLRNLLDAPEQDPAVQQAWLAMHTAGPIPAILAQQSETGAWKGDKSFYTPKFTSTHWSMLLLTELAADPANPGMQLGARFMLDTKEKHLLRWFRSDVHGMSCFWGNLLRYTVYSGFQNDPRLEEVIASLTQEVQTSWRCKYNSGERCAWGAGRALWAFAGLPDKMKTPAVQAAIQSACNLLLDEHDLMKADYPSWYKGKPNSLWSRLNFPLFYQVDRLLVLRALAKLELLDLPGAQPALNWLEASRADNGRWSGASPYRRRTWDCISDRQETQRWVSLHAAVVLQLAHRL
jgi:hypothetical protein